MAQIVVQCLADADLAAAQKLAAALNLPLFLDDKTPPNLSLQFGQEGLQLVDFTGKKPQILHLDFTSGKNLYRLHFGGGAGQMLAKACGVKQGMRPFILDATAGFGSDAWQLAALGCKIAMCERNQVMAALLHDALQRAAQITEFAHIAAQINLFALDAVYLLANWQQFLPFAPQVIYLDPMFPKRTKTAQVKKNMQILQQLVGADYANDNLLSSCLKLAQNRVVVKRPKSAPPLANQTPSYSLLGKTGRFDIYAKCKLC